MTKHVIDFVRSKKPRSSSHRVLSQDDFLDGVVARVQYKDDDREITHYVIFTSQYKGHADGDSQLIQQMSTAAEKYAHRRNRMSEVFNISGWIALVLVGTVAYISLRSEYHDVPEFLKTAVLTIVGFYFGGVLHQRGKGTL